MLFKIAVRILNCVTIASNVIDLLKVLPGVHMCKAAVFELFNFADDLSYKWIFEDYVAEALVMDSLEHCVVIGSLEAEYIE